MIEQLLLGMLLQRTATTAAVRAPRPIVAAQATTDVAKSERQQLEFEKLRLETETLRHEVQSGRLKTWTTFASLGQSVVTILAFLVGAFWVFWRFLLAQERYPNIEFTADIEPIGVQRGVLIVEFIAYIENKGKAQHKMKGLRFDLNTHARRFGRLGSEVGGTDQLPDCGR